MKVSISNKNALATYDIHSLNHGVAYQYNADGKTYTIISLSHPNKLSFPDIMRLLETGFEIIRLDRADQGIKRDWASVQFTEYKGTITLDYTG